MPASRKAVTHSPRSSPAKQEIIHESVCRADTKRSGSGKNTLSCRNHTRVPEPADRVNRAASFPAHTLHEKTQVGKRMRCRKNDSSAHRVFCRHTTFPFPQCSPCNRYIDGSLLRSCMLLPVERKPERRSAEQQGTAERLPGDGLHLTAV